MRIQEVRTLQELTILNEIIRQNWEEEGYDEEIVTFQPDTTLFLLFNEQEEPVATVGLKKVESVKTEQAKKYFRFSNPDDLSGYEENIYEITKLSILKSERGNGYLEAILQKTFEMGVEWNISAFVAIVKPALFIALKGTYKFPVQRIGKKFFYQGEDVVPMMITMEDLLKNPKQYGLLVPELEKEKIG